MCPKLSKVTLNGCNPMIGTTLQQLLAESQEEIQLPLFVILETRSSIQILKSGLSSLLSPIRRGCYTLMHSLDSMVHGIQSKAKRIPLLKVEFRVMGNSSASVQGNSLGLVDFSQPEVPPPSQPIVPSTLSNQFRDMNTIASEIGEMVACEPWDGITFFRVSMGQPWSDISFAEIYFVVSSNGGIDIGNIRDIICELLEQYNEVNGE